MLHLLLTLAIAPAPVAYPPEPAPAAAEDTHGKLPWFKGTFEEAIARAKAEKKLVFVDFWTSWCGWCKKLDRDTYSDDSVVLAMRDFVCVNIDAESEAGGPLAKKYGASGYPTLLVLESDGTLRERLSGYFPPAAFKGHVARIAAKESLDALRAAAAADGSSVDKRWKLATRLQEIGDQAGFDVQVAEIRKLDPEGKSLALHTVTFQDVMKRANELWAQDKAAETPALIQAYIAKETYPELQFRAWNVLGQIHGALVQGARDPAERERHNRSAREAQITAWRVCPDVDALDFGKQILREFWANRVRLTDEDKGFALEVAGRLLKLAEKDPEVLDAMACAQFLNGKKDEALALARRAIELDPRNAEFKKRLEEIGG